MIRPGEYVLGRWISKFQSLNEMAYDYRRLLQQSCMTKKANDCRNTCSTITNCTMKCDQVPSANIKGLFLVLRSQRSSKRNGFENSSE